LFNPPGADKPATNTADKPLLLGAFNAFQDTPLLCGGAVHSNCDFSDYTASIKDIPQPFDLYSGPTPVRKCLINID